MDSSGGIRFLPAGVSRLTSTEDGENRSPRRWLCELTAGAFHPSLPALLGALLVAAVLFLSCVALLTQDLLAEANCGYFMVDWKDDYAYLTCTTLQAARRSSPEPVIALIGASALRESIAGADELAGLMEEALGRTVRVVPLTAAGLTHWEAAGIAGLVAGHLQGVVILEVSPGKMALPRGFFEDLVRQPRLALDSGVFDYEAGLAGIGVPRRTGNFFLDHHGFFSARPTAVLNLMTGPVIPDLHQARTWRSLSEDEWAKAETSLFHRVGAYPENGACNFEVMGRTIERLREAGGIQPVLLESVRNPRADQIMRDSPACREALTRYEEDVRAYAAAWDVPYLDITAEAELTPEAFIDTSHLWDMDAAKRYTRVLASHVAALMKNTQIDRED